MIQNKTAILYIKYGKVNRKRWHFTLPKGIFYRVVDGLLYFKKRYLDNRMVCQIVCIDIIRASLGSYICLDRCRILLFSFYFVRKLRYFLNVILIFYNV